MCTLLLNRTSRLWKTIYLLCSGTVTPVFGSVTVVLSIFSPIKFSSRGTDLFMHLSRDRSLYAPVAVKEIWICIFSCLSLATYSFWGTSRLKSITLESRKAVCPSCEGKGFEEDLQISVTSAIWNHTCVFPLGYFWIWGGKNKSNSIAD